MKGFFSKRNFFSSVVSITLSVAFVASVAFATTISTNIQTDGTLAVTGVSTFAGQLQASTTALFGNSVRAYEGLTVGSDTAENTTDGTIWFKALASNPSAVTQGGLYYNSVSKVLKMSDGTSWFTVGTTTSGISLTGSRLQLGDLTTQYLTLGTTTQQASGQALVTLEATTTTSVPLVLVGFNGQTGSLFSIRDASSARLFYVTAGGNLFATGTIQVTGALTAYGSLGVGTTSPASVFSVQGNAYHSGTGFFGGALTATSTLTVSGLTTLGFASTTGAVSLNGTTANLMINGLATTSAANGNISTIGNVAVGSTTVPTFGELSVSSAATTTVYVGSSAALTGGCIQIEATNGVPYRIYVNATDVATTTSTGHAGIVLVAEAGSCK